MQTFKSVHLPVTARKAIKRGRALLQKVDEGKRPLNVPMIENEFGLAYRSMYASGLVLVASYRCIEVTTLYLFRKMEIRITIQELETWEGPIRGERLFTSVLALPYSEYDASWIMDATNKEISSVRAIADLQQAGECISI